MIPSSVTAPGDTNLSDVIAFQVGLLLSFETSEPQSRPGAKIDAVKIREGMNKMSN